MSSLDAVFPVQAPLCFWVQHMGLQGFALEEVLATTGLNSKTYALPGAFLSDRQELAIYDNIVRLTGSPDSGLDAGARVNINSGGMLGGLVANAVNVVHAGYLLRRFYPLSNRWFMPELMGALSPGRTTIRYRQTADLGPLYRPIIDWNVRGTQQLLVDVFGSSACAFIGEIAFGYAEPPNVDCYLDAFSCPVTFGHDFTFVTFDHGVGGLVNTRRCEFTYYTFLRQCRDTVFRFGFASWQQKVHDILACLDHYPSAEAMAEKLHCSERSLRRHLNDEGVQYSELVDQLRLDRAVYLLRHSSDSVKKIGYQLSYSEPSAFIRAFLRWTGITPTAFRRTVQTR